MDGYVNSIAPRIAHARRSRMAPQGGNARHSRDLGRFSRSILACACLLAAGLAPAQAKPKTPPPASVAEARDLAADARAATARGIPLVLLYSREDCSWCEKVRREHLVPMSRKADAPALIREVHIDRDTPLVDFSGRRTTSADFSRKAKARFAPTLAFHGPDGRTLAEPIVGYLLADFYAAYLDRAIEDSRARLRGEN